MAAAQNAGGGKDLKKLEATKDEFADFSRADMFRFARMIIIAAFGFGLGLGLLIGVLLF